MKWKSHQAVTLVTVYALSGDWLSALAAMQGSIWPDAIEMVFPFLRHRGLSHWFPVYLMPLLIIKAVTPWNGKFFYPPLLQLLPEFFTQQLSIGFLITAFLFWSLLGALLHIPEDALCGRIPIISPNQRFSFGRLFYVGSVKEYIFAVIYSLIVLSFTLEK